MPISNQKITRRGFAKTALGAAAVLASPAIVTAKKTVGGEVIVGSGEHQFAADHHWAQLPDKYTWQTTHNVAVGTDGLVYVIHEGRLDQKDHPSIFVFDPDGKFVRAFGEQFQGGGHGIEVRREAGEDMLYVCNYQQQRSIAKLSASGEQVWRRGAPMESGLYADGEDDYPRPKDNNPWGRNRFMPTNIAFHPGGGFFVADGYGSYRVHYYNDNGEWVRSFGEPMQGDENGAGRFNLPHGVWIDSRGGEPTVAVADRANNRLQWFTPGGEHLRTQDGFHWPANIDTHGDLMLVPELFARVSLLGKDNEVVAVLGDDLDRISADTKRSIRSNESEWLPGKFVHPHDACFDADGNIYVAEWVQTGRVTKLARQT